MTKISALQSEFLMMILLIPIRMKKTKRLLYMLPYMRMQPALGVSVKSVRLVAGRLGFYSLSGHTKDFKISIRSFRARRSAQVEGLSSFSYQKRAINLNFSLWLKEWRKIVKKAFPMISFVKKTAISNSLSL